MFRERTELKIADLFNSNHKHCQFSMDITDYEFRWNQTKHALHHYPELFDVLKSGWKIHYNDIHKFFEFVTSKYSSSDKMSYKEVVKIVYNCFAQNQNLAIRINPNSKNIHIREASIWKDEDFENLRVRCLHEIRDYLGMNHGGHGIYSVDVNKNKYYNPHQFRETKEGNNYDLFRGHDFEQTFHSGEAASK